MTDKLVKTVRQLVPHVLSKGLPKDIAVIKISSKTSRYLGYRYRRKKTPTNVLSFRYSPGYGEILICPEVIRREAQNRGNSYKYQMTWMIIHGMLHLAGIHHEKSKNTAKKFERLEQRILGKTFVN